MNPEVEQTKESQENPEAKLRRVYTALQADHLGLWDLVPEFAGIAKEEQARLAAGASPQEIAELSGLEEKRFEIERGLWEQYSELTKLLSEEEQKRAKKGIMESSVATYVKRHGPYGSIPERGRLGKRDTSARPLEGGERQLFDRANTYVTSPSKDFVSNMSSPELLQFADQLLQKEGNYPREEAVVALAFVKGALESHMNALKKRTDKIEEFLKQFPSKSYLAGEKGPSRVKSKKG